jgi:hypothetical protein
MQDRISAPFGAARDQPLSFQWSGISDQQLALAGLSTTGPMKRLAARRAIVANLVVASSTGQWVSYSRDRNHYTGKRRYFGDAYTYTNVLGVIEELREAQLIQEDRSTRGQLGWQSRMRPVRELLLRLGRLPELHYAPRELVRLKESGRLVDYFETAVTRRMRREVHQLNEAFASVRIALVSPDVPWTGASVVMDGQVIHPARVAGYRVFNGSWNLGGRYYGPFWQTLPRWRRLYLTIGGEPIVEHDFAQLHPRLLYAAFARSLDGDAYTVAGHDRDLAKCAWQILINASSRRSAISAVARQLGGPRYQAEAEPILRALEVRHAAINRAFYTGEGLRLQRMDSDLMMRIGLRCISEGIVALPVHDSCIVQVRHSARTQEIMDEELAAGLRSISGRRSRTPPERRWQNRGSCE